MMKAFGEQLHERSSLVYLMSLWWFAWTGGGGTKEPVITHGAPEAGREVGLMYSFSSQSDDGFSPLDTSGAGRALTIYRKHKAWLDFVHLWFINQVKPCSFTAIIKFECGIHMQ